MIEATYVCAVCPCTCPTVTPVGQCQCCDRGEGHAANLRRVAGVTYSETETRVTVYEEICQGARMASRVGWVERRQRFTGRVPVARVRSTTGWRKR